MGGFDIIGIEDGLDRFMAAAAGFGITAAQYSLVSKYRTVIGGEGFRDMSFCLAKGGEAKLAVPCHKTGQALNFNNAPICLLGNGNDKKLVSAALDELVERAKVAGAVSVIVADRTSGSSLSDTGNEAFRRDGVPTARLEAAIDLSLPEETIRSHLRESYKSLINQTRRDMTFTVLDRGNADKSLFEDFRLFHLKVAGRQTRPAESWEVQFEMIAAGCAEIVLGYVAPHGLVSAALFTDFGTVTTYAVAVYDRELFANRSLAHANVYEGIVRAKNRGQGRFLLGNVPPRGTVSDKEYNIGNFKKGFCDRLNSYLEWTIPVTGAGA